VSEEGCKRRWLIGDSNSERLNIELTEPKVSILSRVIATQERRDTRQVH
jgi:hypothetical protein